MKPTLEQRWRTLNLKRAITKCRHNAWDAVWSTAAARCIQARAWPHRHYQTPCPALPGDGQAEFLINGTCDNQQCDYRCACPEGWTWPLCPKCGAQVMPRRQHNPRGFGNSKGYVATIKPEGEALVEAWEKARMAKERTALEAEVRRFEPDLRGLADS